MVNVTTHSQMLRTTPSWKPLALASCLTSKAALTQWLGILLAKVAKPCMLSLSSQCVFFSVMIFALLLWYVDNVVANLGSNPTPP